MKNFFTTLLFTLLFAPLMWAQNTVTGTVVDGDGVPLIGVNILETGTSNGTVTDFDGKYEIIISDGASLTFSYTGFESQTVEYTGNNSINLTMAEGVNLDEVVVTALGIEKKKKAVTYSTQGVGTEDLTKARTVNVLNGLSGKVAGLSVTSGASGVGSSSKVLLRGNRSINGSNQPLYVVDGVLLDGDISNLSASDIEDIQVLKGANAAALYGSRASNGAIIVTTKSGKGLGSGITTSVGLTATVDNPILLTNFQDNYGQGSAGQYSPSATTSWGPRFDGSQVAHWSNNPNSPLSGSTYAYTAQPDNVKDFFRNGLNLATSVGVNINRENGNTYLGYTNTYAEGIVPGNDLRRHNLIASVNSYLTDKLQANVKANYIRSDFSNVFATGEGFDNPYRYLYILPRNIRTADIEQYQFINEEGKNRQHYFRPRFNGGGNPYWTINNVLRPQLNERLIGLVSLKYHLLPNLSILGRSTIDSKNSDNEELWFNDTYTVAQFGRYQKVSSNLYDWNTDVLVNYNTDITEDIRFDINAGANLRNFRINNLTGNGANFTIENFFSLANTQDPTATEDYAEFETQSVYGLAEFSYRNALFLNLTARNDWSSTLPSDNRSYFYPSVGLTAIISDLTTLPSWLYYLKLRGSWAEVGSDTRAYQLSRRANILNGTLEVDPTQPNPNLRPETTTSTEFGFDARFVQNKYRLDFTWYKTNSTDQIFTSPAPSGSGVGNIFQNGGDVENVGVEIIAGATIIDNKDFSWDLDINFSAYKSEVVAIAEGFDQLNLNTDFIRQYSLRVGDEFGTVFSRGFLRDDQGRVIVDDLGLPQVTPGLSVPVANFTPDWLGGIRNSFNYKNFNLSALVDIRQGGTVISFTEAILAGNGLLDYTEVGREGGIVFGQDVFGGETAVNSSGEANTTQINAEDLWNRLGGRNTPVGEAFVRDASNVRLRELVLGYSLPASTLKNSFFKSLNISFVGRNLFFFSNKAENVDPEVLTSTTTSRFNNSNDEITSEGREAFAPPTTRSLGLSLNFTF